MAPSTCHSPGTWGCTSRGMRTAIRRVISSMMVHVMTGDVHVLLQVEVTPDIDLNSIYFMYFR